MRHHVLSQLQTLVQRALRVLQRVPAHKPVLCGISSLPSTPACNATSWNARSGGAHHATTATTTSSSDHLGDRVPHILQLLFQLLSAARECQLQL